MASHAFPFLILYGIGKHIEMRKQTDAERHMVSLSPRFRKSDYYVRSVIRYSAVLVKKQVVVVNFALNIMKLAFSSGAGGEKF